MYYNSGKNIQSFIRKQKWKRQDMANVFNFWNERVMDIWERELEYFCREQIRKILKDPLQTQNNDFGSTSDIFPATFKTMIWAKMPMRDTDEYEWNVDEDMLDKLFNDLKVDIPQKYDFLIRFKKIVDDYTDNMLLKDYAGHKGGIVDVEK